MILGENPNRSNSTVHVPPWTFLDDPSPLSGVSVNFDGNANATDYSPFYLQEALTALQLYLPSVTEAEIDSDYESESTVVTDVFSSDQFRMFDFKVKKCTRGRSHDWTECPYAHPGEKARRRDPRRYHYSGTACAEFRKGNCKRGDSCEFAHGVFECWLHPSRYRTQPCKDGTSCRRRVCFFAHTAEQLRVLPQQILSPSSTRSVNSIPSYDGSPLRQAIEACAKQITFSPLSPPSLSPPVTPKAELLSSSPPQSPMIHSMVANLRNLELNKELGLGQGKVQSPSSSPWNVQVGSPLSVTRPGYCSLPTTPTRPGIRFLDFWDLSCGEEPAMERVESGRDLRAKMFEKLRKENSVGVPDEDSSIGGGGLDVGWVSELIK